MGATATLCCRVLGVTSATFGVGVSRAADITRSFASNLRSVDRTSRGNAFKRLKKWSVWSCTRGAQTRDDPAVTTRASVASTPAPCIWLPRDPRDLLSHRTLAGRQPADRRRRRIRTAHVAQAMLRRMWRRAAASAGSAALHLRPANHAHAGI